MSSKQLPWVEGLKPGDLVYCTTTTPEGAPLWLAGVVVRRQSANIWAVTVRGAEHQFHQVDIRSLAWCKSKPQPWWAGNKGRWR